MTTKSTTPRNRQQGATLIIILLILVLIMQLGIAAMLASDTQQRLSGNLQFEDMALNRAEAAIATAESWLATGDQDAGFIHYNSATPHLHPIGHLNSLAAPDNTPATLRWNDSNSLTVVRGDDTQRYLIERISLRARPQGYSLGLGDRSHTACNTVNLPHHCTWHGSAWRHQVDSVLLRRAGLLAAPRISMHLRKNRVTSLCALLLLAVPWAYGPMPLLPMTPTPSPWLRRSARGQQLQPEPSWRHGQGPGNRCSNHGARAGNPVPNRLRTAKLVGRCTRLSIGRAGQVYGKERWSAAAELAKQNWDTGRYIATLNNTGTIAGMPFRGNLVSRRQCQAAKLQPDPGAELSARRWQQRHLPCRPLARPQFCLGRHPAFTPLLSCRRRQPHSVCRRQ